LIPLHNASRRLLFQLGQPFLFSLLSEKNGSVVCKYFIENSALVMKLHNIFVAISTY
jgi:hypothetical protein